MATADSSQRKQANSVNHELAQERDRYRELLDLLQAIVWRGSAQTFQFTFISPYAEALLGYPTQRWLDEPNFWREHIHPDDREWTVEFCAKATKEKRSHEFDYRMIAADGRVIWLHDVVHVIVEGDQAAELIGVMVDITEKKQAEEALAQSESRLRFTIDAIPQQIWSSPVDGSNDFANQRLLSYVGMSLEQLKGDGWEKILHPDDRERVLKAWEESVAHGTPSEVEERHRGADGKYRWFLNRAVPVRDDQGRVVRWYGTNTDIEDRKRAEHDLRESEQRWRAVFDNSTVGIALLDKTGHFLAANSTYEEMVGRKSEELHSLTCRDLTYTEQDCLATEAHIRELLEGRRERFELEKRYRRSDGSLIWVRSSGSLVREADGSPRFLVFLVADITEKKRLHDQLARERDRLRLLLDLSNQIASHLELPDLFGALADSLRELEGWEYSAILLPEAAGKHLRIYLNVGGGGVLKEGMSVPLDGGMTGRTYRSGEPAIFGLQDLPLEQPDYPQSGRLPELVKAGFKVGCALPLRHAGEILGILNLATRKDLDSAKQDLGFLQQLANLIAVALNNALLYGQLSESREKLKHEKKTIEDQIRSEFNELEIIGSSAGLRNVLGQVETVAPTDSTVLVLGETGTGKELIARAIHNLSGRRDQAFIKVDCAAIPGALMESELFGHEKGAFTGAIAQKIGRFEIADKGTLFLDEIGDVPLELQPKLLRVLQDQTFERVGGNRTRHLDVRIVAATNRDLARMVEKGEFRDDLYYRLKVFPILIPPLRERAEDIPLLVKHYVDKYARRMKKRVTGIPPDAMDVFSRYPWPGNVRELQNFIERAVILTSGNVLQAPLAELKQAIREMHGRGGKSTGSLTMEEIERESILQALRESKWVVGGPHGAAARLGMKRTTLASRMEKLGVSRRGKSS
jgi:formate hydrogenlyase transcriptional activator